MITPRLQKIIELIDKKTIADIGTDHAYIPIRLAQDKKITRAVACDKNKGPIDIATDNIRKYGLENIIECRQGSGLEPIEKGETELIIIAGMGGKLIADIIEENPEKAKSSLLLLQPMNAQYELRKRLYEMGFKIIHEDLAKEGFKVYNIMIAEEGRDKEKKDDIYYHVPEELLSHELCGMLLLKKRKEFTKILNGQINSSDPDSQTIDKFRILLDKLSQLDKIYKEEKK